MPVRNPLRAALIFEVTLVRRNNGVIEALFSLPGGMPDEYVSTNLLKEHGVPKIGERYEITFKPLRPTEI